MNIDDVAIGPDTTVLVTGGTGSFGRKFVDIVLNEYRVKKLIVFSRDELKQHEMRQQYPDSGEAVIRYFIGDVRDLDRLRRAMHGVDVVIHAAALKQVPACEYNPLEAIKTNVLGASNIIDAALDSGVKKVIALSTDKAVNPVNLYGATKLCAEKLFVQSNAYSGSYGTKFSCVRYGNVLGSRGSVVPLFLEQRESGVIRVTDHRMTRFWITVDDGVRFVINCIGQMHGGEVFVPKIPSMSVAGLASALAPNCDVERIGIRPGEKLHEVLVSEEEARHTIELDGMFVVLPVHPWWNANGSTGWTGGRTPRDGFRYSSDTNAHQLDDDGLKDLLETLGI